MAIVVGSRFPSPSRRPASESLLAGPSPGAPLIPATFVEEGPLGLHFEWPYLEHIVPHSQASGHTQLHSGLVLIGVQGRDIRGLDVGEGSTLFRAVTRPVRLVFREPTEAEQEEFRVATAATRCAEAAAEALNAEGSGEPQRQGVGPEIGGRAPVVLSDTR